MFKWQEESDRGRRLYLRTTDLQWQGATLEQAHAIIRAEDAAAFAHFGIEVYPEAPIGDPLMVVH